MGKKKCWLGKRGGGGQTMDNPKCFHGGAEEIFFCWPYFFFERWANEIFYGQTRANDGQTNAVSFFQKFEFGGAIFTDLNYCVAEQATNIQQANAGVDMKTMGCLKACVMKRMSVVSRFFAPSETG